MTDVPDVKYVLYLMVLVFYLIVLVLYLMVLVLYLMVLKEHHFKYGNEADV